MTRKDNNSLWNFQWFCVGHLENSRLIWQAARSRFAKFAGNHGHSNLQITHICSRKIIKTFKFYTCIGALACFFFVSGNKLCNKQGILSDSESNEIWYNNYIERGGVRGFMKPIQCRNTLWHNSWQNKFVNKFYLQIDFYYFDLKISRFILIERKKCFNCKSSETCMSLI